MQALNIVSRLASGGIGILVIGAPSVLALAVAPERRRERVAGIGIACERQRNAMLDGLPESAPTPMREAAYAH